MAEFYVLIAGMLVAFAACAIVMRCRISETQKWFMGSVIGALGYMVSEIFMCHADTARIYMYTKEFKYVSLMWMNISLLLGLYGICGVMIGNKMRNVIYALGHIYCLACLTISSHDWFYSSVEVIPINVKKGLYTHETEVPILFRIAKKYCSKNKLIYGCILICIFDEQYRTELG